MKLIPFFSIFIIILTFFSLSSQLSYTKETSSSISLSKVAQIDTVGQARDVIVRNNIAFVSDMGQNVDTTGGLYIFDVSDPSHPTQLSHFYDGGRSHQIALYNDSILLVADNTGGLEIFDVSNLSHPLKIGTFTGASYINGLVIRNTTAFVTSFISGLIVVDFSNFSSPVELSRFSLSSVQPLVLYHDFVFVSGITNLFILDISNITSIMQVSHYNYEVSDYFFNDTNLYVACSGSLSTPAQGFKILNISDLMNITELASFQDGGHPVGLTLYNHFAFIADHDLGIEVLDTSNPSQISKVTSFFDGGNSFELTIVGSLLYVADGTDGLEILQISISSQTYNSQAIDGFITFDLLIILITLSYYPRKKV